MGVWGDGPFDNDAAADWSGRFVGADLAAGLDLIEDALTDPELAPAAAALIAHIAGELAARTAHNADAIAWAWEARDNPLARSWALERFPPA